MKKIVKSIPTMLAALMVALSFASCDSDNTNAPDEWDWDWDENYEEYLARPLCPIPEIKVTAAVWHGKRIKFNDENKAMLLRAAAQECEYPLAITTTACGQVKKAIGYKALDIDMLKVSGPVDEDDLTYIKRCVAAGNLRHVDLSAAQLPENTIPALAFAVTEYPDEGGLDPVFLPLFRLDLPEGVTLDYGSLCDVLLTDIDLSKVKAVGESALRRTVFINGVLDVPSTLQSVGEEAFAEIGDGDLVVNYNYKEVSVDCFASAKVKAINFSENLEHIRAGGLWGIQGMTTLQLPEGLKTIEVAGVAYCESLESISLPSTVEYIGGGGLAYNSALKNLKVSFTDPAVAVGPVDDDKFMELVDELRGDISQISFAFGRLQETDPYSKDVVVSVPSAALKAFKNAVNWNLWFETFQGY